jgi:hypothetical protein
VCGSWACTSLCIEGRSRERGYADFGWAAGEEWRSGPRSRWWSEEADVQVVRPLLGLALTG